MWEDGCRGLTVGALVGFVRHRAWFSPSLIALFAVALALLGCGTADKPTRPASTAVTGAIPTIQPIGSQKHASRRFLLEVNEVCRTVRQGAPPPLSPPYRQVVVSRYSQAARPATQRTIVSLRRLALQSDGQALRVIANGYVALQATYASSSFVARTAKSSARLAQAIQLREQSVSASARSAGVPACGVAGR